MMKLELLEPEIGETFEYKGQLLKCVEAEDDGGCGRCAFEHFNGCMKVFACAKFLRRDDVKVYFEPVWQKKCSCFVVDIPEKPLDVPVGRAVEVDGNFYRCAPSRYCDDCDIMGTGACGMLTCISSRRADNTPVVFKKIQTTKI